MVTETVVKVYFSFSILKHLSFCLILIESLQCVCVLNNSAVLVFFPTDETMVINVFCGVVSGVLSSSLANPTDVLKVTLSC